MKRPSLYPVPSHGVVHLKDVKSGAVYKIYDYKGSEILKGICDSDHQSIDILELAGGNYFLVYESEGDKEIIHFNVVI